jgi:hypothetical protein
VVSLLSLLLKLMVLNTDKNDFRFFVPLELVKGKKDTNGKQKIGFKGIASTPDKDSDGETLLPEGFELKYFLNNGFVNWNHQAKTNPGAIIGEPTAAEVRPEGLYIETELYADHPLAQQVYDLGEMLSKRKGNRKLGFSIEGKALERDENDPKIVKRVKLTGVAITPTPKNTTTYADLIKGESCDQEWEYDLEKGEANGGAVTYIIDYTDESGNRVTVDSLLQIKITKVEKALSTGNGAALIRESLEGSQKIVTLESDKKENDITFRSKILNKSEVYERLFTFVDEVEKADLIYSLISKIQKSMDTTTKGQQTSKIEITEDAVEKALITLGINKIEETDLEKGKKDKDKDSTIEKKTAPDGDNDEDDDDDEVKAMKDDLAKKKKECEDMEKSILDKKQAKISGSDKNTSDSLNKAELDLIKGNQDKLAEQVQALGVVLKKTLEKVESLGTIEKAEVVDLAPLTNKLDDLSKAIEEIGNQSMPRKSVIHTKGFLNKGDEGGEMKNDADGKNTMSISKELGKIITLLDESIDYNNVTKGEDKLIADDMAQLEGSGKVALTPHMVQRIQKRLNVTLVN